MTMVANKNSIKRQNVIVNPLFLGSTISETYRKCSVFTPQLYMNITNENELTGIQLNLLKSTPIDVE